MSFFIFISISAVSVNMFSEQLTEEERKRFLKNNDRFDFYRG